MAEPADKDEEVIVVVEDKDDGQTPGTELADGGTPAVVEESDDPSAAIEALKTRIAEYENQHKNHQAELDAARRSREEAQRAREEAERASQSARNDATQTMRQAEEARYDAIVNALAAAKGQLEQHKAAYKQAINDGDASAAADIAADMALVGARINTFEGGKAEIEARAKEARPQQQQQDQPRQPTQQEIRERWVQDLPPRSSSWVRQHYDRYFGDEGFQQQVQRGHHRALGEGLRPDTDDYFRVIEEETGLRQRPQTNGHVEQQQVPTSTAGRTVARRSPAVAAPPAGSAVANGTRSPGAQTITLTAEEREFCRLNDIPEANYAKNKLQLIEEGQISRPH